MIQSLVGFVWRFSWACTPCATPTALNSRTCALSGCATAGPTETPGVALVRSTDLSQREESAQLSQVHEVSTAARSSADEADDGIVEYVCGASGTRVQSHRVPVLELGRVFDAVALQTEQPAKYRKQPATIAHKGLHCAAPQGPRPQEAGRMPTKWQPKRADWRTPSDADMGMAHKGMMEGGSKGTDSLTGVTTVQWVVDCITHAKTCIVAMASAPARASETSASAAHAHVSSHAVTLLWNDAEANDGVLSVAAQKPRH